MTIRKHRYLHLGFTTLTELQLRSSYKIMLWLGATTALGTVLKGSSIRKVEYHSFKVLFFFLSADCTTWKTPVLAKVHPVVPLILCNSHGLPLHCAASPYTVFHGFYFLPLPPLSFSVVFLPQQFNTHRRYSANPVKCLM